MRLLRGALLVLALLLPAAGALCCVPSPADGCCSEETACPLGAGADCALTHATPAASYTIERALVDTPMLLPAGVDFVGATPLRGGLAPAFVRSARGPTELERHQPLRI